jgi:site-specific DNA recombinase
MGFQWEEQAIGLFYRVSTPSKPGTEVRNMDKKPLRGPQLIPAVAYLRRSTSRQEKSLEDQRTEIERYAAANGYRILRWFQDDGISGDATERRTGFLALHKSACDSRDFDVILVWDQDRFGRFDSMEAGYWIHPLRKAGVGLVSVTEGPINWGDFTGRVMYSL